MRVTSVTWEKPDGTRVPGTYFSTKASSCPNCHHTVVDPERTWHDLPPKVGQECRRCHYKIVEVVKDKTIKTKRRVLYSGTDNRGNPFRVSECFGEQDYGRKGKDCKLPCMMIGGTNHQTSSARSHTIHIPATQVDAVVAALKGTQV